MVDERQREEGARNDGKEATRRPILADVNGCEGHARDERCPHPRPAESIDPRMHAVTDRLIPQKVIDACQDAERDTEDDGAKAFLGEGQQGDPLRVLRVR